MATKRTLPQSVLQQTLAYLFDNRPHILAEPLARWLATSKPFALFAQTYQQKIRKKVRMAHEAEEVCNLACELRTAYLLMQEPRFAVEYEPYTIQQGRSPDFAVVYRTHTRFHVEVTRLRSAQPPRVEPEAGGRNNLPDATGNPEESRALLLRYEGRRLADVAGDKLSQLAPTTPNVLWIWVQSPVMHEVDVEQQLRNLKRRAEQRDVELLARYSFRDPADFIRHYQRLSMVLIQNLQAQAGQGYPLVWTNNDAKYPLPAKMSTLLGSLITQEVD